MPLIVEAIEIPDKKFKTGEPSEIAHALLNEENAKPCVAYTLQMREGCAGGGKGPLIQEDKIATLSAHNIQTLFQPMVMATAQANAEIMDDRCPTITEAAGTSGNNRPIVCYGISSFSSNAMLSDNPHSGIYEADTARTLDLNGGNPACNQGGY